MPVSEERLRELARTHLSDYGYADAMTALVDVSDCTELPVPDEVLVQAARQHLETVDAGGEVDPCGVLRKLALRGYSQASQALRVRRA